MVSPGQRSAAGCANLKWFEKQEWLAAVIPLWFHLHLPSCSPRFKSQAHHLRFCQFVLVKLCNEKRTKINKKRPGLSHLFFEKARVVEKHTIFIYNISHLSQQEAEQDKRIAILSKAILNGNRLCNRFQLSSRISDFVATFAFTELQKRNL